MTKLSRIVMDVRSRGYRSDIENPYGMHATLSRCIAGGEERTLWRIQESSGPRVTILVQHGGDIDLGQLAERGELRAPALETLLVDEALIDDGAVHRFRIHANPTVTRGGKRYGATGQEAHYAWIHRQSEANGFEVLGVLAHTERMLTAKPLQPNRPAIEFLQVVYDGHLRVANRQKLLVGIRNGIGHAKAFGCGLLTIDGIYRRL